MHIFSFPPLSAPVPFAWYCLIHLHQCENHLQWPVTLTQLCITVLMSHFNLWAVYVHLKLCRPSRHDCIAIKCKILNGCPAYQWTTWCSGLGNNKEKWPCEICAYRSEQNNDVSQKLLLNGILIYMVLALRIISEYEIKIVRINARRNFSMHCRHASTANEGILVT